MPQDNYEVRQSSFSNGDVIEASLLNAEYDQLIAVFHNLTGHTHGGDQGEGSFIPLIANLEGTTSIRVNNANPSDAKLIFKLNGVDVLTFSESSGLLLIDSTQLTHDSQALDVYLAGLEVAVGDAASDAAAADASAVRAEAAAASMGVPTIVADAGTHVIDNAAALADVVFMGDGTLTLPTVLTQGRRFTIRVSFTASSEKLVTIGNPSFTLVGDKVSVPAGTDLVLSPGELVVLESISSSELEII